MLITLSVEIDSRISLTVTIAHFVEIFLHLNPTSIDFSFECGLLLPKLPFQIGKIQFFFLIEQILSAVIFRIWYCNLTTPDRKTFQL